MCAFDKRIALCMAPSHTRARKLGRLQASVQRAQKISGRSGMRSLASELGHHQEHAHDKGNRSQSEREFSQFRIVVIAVHLKCTGLAHRCSNHLTDFSGRAVEPLSVINQLAGRWFDPGAKIGCVGLTPLLEGK